MNSDSANTTLQKILETQLLTLLAVSSGSGGGAGILSGSGNPNGSVASTATPQLYYDTATPGLYINSGAIGSTVWQQIA